MAFSNSFMMLAAFIALAAVPAFGAEYPTCTAALAALPGYSYTTTALSNCPDLAAMQSDPTLVKTFFVPSNKAIEDISKHIGLPVEKVIGKDLKAIMCNFLKYHIVDGFHPVDTWTKGKAFTTNYFGAKLTVAATEGTPEVKAVMGSPAKIEKIVTCGSAVAFGVDTVLAPFPVPKLG